MTTPWFVYIIQSESAGILYTGISTDVARRLRQHNGFVAGGAKSTRWRRPWKLVHVEGPMTRSEAQRREMSIKRMRRAKKLGLITT